MRSSIFKSWVRRGHIDGENYNHGRCQIDAIRDDVGFWIVTFVPPLSYQGAANDNTYA